MSRRVRWYSIESVGKLFPPLAQAVGRQRFGADTSDGFVAEEVSKARIAACYVERVELQDRVEDPFGNVKLYPRVDYRRTDFVLSSEFPHLLLRNAPRTIRAFMARLGELAEHQVAISPVELDIMGVIAGIEKAVGRVSVNRLVVGGYPLSPRAGAEVVISGAGDVRAEAKQFTANRFSRVAAATVSWGGRSRSVECEIAGSGVICADDSGETVERLVRDVLRASARRSLGT